MITRTPALERVVEEENWNSSVVCMLQVVLMSPVPPLPALVRSNSSAACSDGRMRSKQTKVTTAFITYLYAFKMDRMT